MTLSEQELSSREKSSIGVFEKFDKNIVLEIIASHRELTKECEMYKGIVHDFRHCCVTKDIRIAVLEKALDDSAQSICNAWCEHSEEQATIHHADCIKARKALGKEKK